MKKPAIWLRQQQRGKMALHIHSNMKMCKHTYITQRGVKIFLAQTNYRLFRSWIWCLSSCEQFALLHLTQFIRIASTFIRDVTRWRQAIILLFFRANNRHSVRLCCHILSDRFRKQQLKRKTNNWNNHETCLHWTLVNCMKRLFEKEAWCLLLEK